MPGPTTSQSGETERSAMGEDRSCARCGAQLPGNAASCPRCGESLPGRGGIKDFEQAAAEDRIGFFAEFWDFLKHNKKWWLIPILLMIVLIGLVAVLASNPAATPFIYPFF